MRKRRVVKAVANCPPQIGDSPAPGIKFTGGDKKGKEGRRRRRIECHGGRGATVKQTAGGVDGTQVVSK